MPKVTKGLWVYGHFQQGNVIIFIYPQVFHFLCRISDLFLNTILLASTKNVFSTELSKGVISNLVQIPCPCPKHCSVFPSHQRKKI